MMKEFTKQGIAFAERQIFDNERKCAMLLLMETWQCLGCQKTIVPKKVTHKYEFIDFSSAFVGINSGLYNLSSDSLERVGLRYLFESYVSINVLDDIKKDEMKGTAFMIVFMTEVKLNEFCLSLATILLHFSCELLYYYV
jgi:hypothetical protein